MNTNQDTEKLAFFHVINTPDLLRNYKGEFWESPQLQKLFDIIKPHIVEFQEVPTFAQTLELVKINDAEDVLPQVYLEQLWTFASRKGEYADEWLKKQAVFYGEWGNLVNTLNKVYTYYRQVDDDVSYENCDKYLGTIKSIFQTGMSLSFSDKEGYDFFDFETHIEDENSYHKTGYKFFDDSLGGGWSPKTLNVFMGPPKVGKSKWLCNMAAKSICQGHNTIYITLEMKPQVVMRRVGSQLYKINIRDYKGKVKDDPQGMVKAQKAFFHSLFPGKPGFFVVEEYPTSTATADDIEAFVLKKEQEYAAKTNNQKFKFQNIIIDYLNIMRDKKNPNSENTYAKLKSICEDTRAIAVRNEWCIISATQTNRGGVELTDPNMTNVSESMGIVATVDSMFAIIQNSIMRAAGIYYIKNIAIRDAESMGDKKKFVENRDYLDIMEDLTEEVIHEDMPLPDQWKEVSTNPTTPKKYNKNTEFKKQDNNTQQTEHQTQMNPPSPPPAMTQMSIGAGINSGLFGFDL